jgi:hypothetical protein
MTSAGRWPRLGLLLALAGGIVLAIVLAFAVLGDDPESPNDVDPTPTQAGGGADGGATAPPLEPTIGEIVWAAEIAPGTNQPIAPVDRFPTDAPTIYAVLPVTGLPIGTVLQAAWSYNDTPLDQMTTSLTVEATSADVIWIEFHLYRETEDPWPDGIYEVVITIDRATRRESSVEVIDDA